MALQVVSPAVSVFKVVGVKDGVEQTEEHTFKRGDLLPDWVTPYQQFVLSQTGMARQVGDFPDPGLVRAEDMPAPVLMPEHDPRTVLGTNVTGPMEVTKRVTDQDAAGAAGRADDGELPADSATKPEWEDAAVRQGMSRNRAESLKKADLIEQVKAEQAKTDSAKAESARTESAKTAAEQAKVSAPAKAAPAPVKAQAQAAPKSER